MQEQEVSAVEDFDDLPDLTNREQILMDVLEANEDPDNNLEMKKLRPLLKSHLGFFQGKSHYAFCNAVVKTVTKLVTSGKIKFDKKNKWLRAVSPLSPMTSPAINSQNGCVTSRHTPLKKGCVG